MILNKNNPDFEFNDEYFLYLIDNHYDFDEEDIKMFIECCEINRIPQELRRWTRWINSICEAKDRYFVVGWDQGLTEHQENIYSDSYITEVTPIETTKRIIVTQWRDKENNIVCETMNDE